MVQLLDTASYLTREMVDAPQAGISGPHNTLKALSLKPLVVTWSIPLAAQASGDLVELFHDLPWSTEDAWQDAHLTECMFYLRRSKLVDVPLPFKELIPASEFELNQMIRAQ